MLEHTKEAENTKEFNNFGFYGEEADEQTETVLKGITGNVSDFTYTNLSYPCIIFKEDFKCPKHQLRVVSNMVNSKAGEKDISLYFVNEGELYKIGNIGGLQVNAFLEIIGLNNVIGYYKEGLKLTGDKLYTLSVSSF